MQKSQTRIHLMFGSSQHRFIGNVSTHEDADIVVVSLSDRIVIFPTANFNTICAIETNSG
jgi:hypothetical protein